MAEKWFTFGYNNTDAWKEKCERCGKLFPRHEVKRFEGEEPGDLVYYCEECIDKIKQMAVEYFNRKKQ